MPDSVRAYLQQDMECEELLECFYGLKDLDRQAFEVIADSDSPLTVDAVAEAVNRERSTAYRSIQRLMDAGFVEKEQVNYDKGGYYHVYQPVDATDVSNTLQRMLNDWYAKMGQLIGEFEEKYADTPTVATTDN
ncbi:MAG: helix-turn-helix domain-containing protein [Halobacteriales archaeon]